MEFTDDVTHGAGGFLVLGRGFEPQLTHGINDSPLNRLQAITDMRQCPIENHIHGVIKVGFFGIAAQRYLFNRRINDGGLCHKFYCSCGDNGFAVMDYWPTVMDISGRRVLV